MALDQKLTIRHDYLK